VDTLSRKQEAGRYIPVDLQQEDVTLTSTDAAALSSAQEKIVARRLAEEVE
jgi:hypothetical protein